MLVWPTDGGHYHHHEWAWQLLLAAFPEYNKLGKRLDLESIMLQLVALAEQHRRHVKLGMGDRFSVQFTEYGAGAAELTKAMLQHGITCCSFDRSYSEEHDMSTPSGLRRWTLHM